ncbi:MAG: ATP-binding protein [Betaproteobacteria bacterium]|nr:ATP-binding protein [Betaproteobacteria bacterium]
MCMKIALLGAESTGKTQLATDLVAHLLARGLSAIQVPEVLREWCNEQGRTPQPHEQPSIAQAQAERVKLAAGSAAADYLIADTTPMMTAIYSHKLFADASLYHFALAHQSSYDLTLVTALDLPWVADGLQRDGVHVREPVDAMLRLALESGQIPYQVIYGKGIDRLQNSINAINSIAKNPIPYCRNSFKLQSRRMQNWVCEKCSDPDCEHVIFRNLLHQQTG